MGATYKKLLVWKLADELAFEIYAVTRNFPEHERFGITSQLRRAGLSIPTNIVEGVGRAGKLEKKRFLNIALGSLFEVEYFLDFSNRLGYLNSHSIRKVSLLREKTGGLLWNFHKSL